MSQESLPTLSRRLESFRHQVHALSMNLEVSTRIQDKEGIRRAQDSFLDLWRDWDTLIEAVAKLEQLTYNTADAIAMCQQDDDE